MTSVMHQLRECKEKFRPTPQVFHVGREGGKKGFLRNRVSNCATTIRRNRVGEIENRPEEVQ